MYKEQLIKKALQKTRRQCILALISAVVVAVCVCIGVTMNLVTLHDENFDHMGIRTFCMFTVNSNICAGIAMMICLPFTIDGLRTGNYHLPNWVVDVMFVAVTAVALTFLVSLLLLAPVKGFVLIFTGSRFFLHGVCPVLSIASFCCFICSHYIKLKETFVALVPVFIYAVLYFVMVVVIGEARGGWNDFYGFATRLPVWIPMSLILPLTFGIATVLRLLHNKCCMNRKERAVKLFREIGDGGDLRDAVATLARVQKGERRTANVVIPARMIGYLIEDNKSDMTLEEGCRSYLEAFLTDLEIEDMSETTVN